MAERRKAATMLSIIDAATVEIVARGRNWHDPCPEVCVLANARVGAKGVSGES
jgi:hypothetical protein